MQTQTIPDPVHNGRKASEWLTEFSSSGGSHGDGRYFYKTRTAFVEMGTNAVPLLERELNASDSKLKTLIFGWLAKLRLVEFVPAHERCRRAVHACCALDEKFAALIPALVRILERPDPDNNVTLALGALGHESILHLARGIQHPDGEMRTSCVLALRMMVHEEQRNPSGYLLRKLQSENEDTRFWAVVAVNAMEVDPARMVPALVERLGDRSPRVRLQSLRALSTYGRMPRNAIKTVEALAKDPDQSVGSEAKLLLERLPSPKPQ